MRRGLVTVAVVLALPAAAVGHDFRTAGPMDELLVSAGGQHVHATPGSSCTTYRQPDGRAVGICRDMSADLPVQGRLDLVVDQPLRLHLDHPAVEVVAALHATDGRGPRARIRELEPRPAGGATPATEWEARIEPGLPPTDMRLVVLAEYDPHADPTGDAAFQAAVRAPGRLAAPRAAVAAARRRARERLGEAAEVTFTLRSERRPRWALVDGRHKRRLWAAWVRQGDAGRWRVRRFRTRRFEPRGVPCDIRPAFSEPSC